MSVPSRWPDPAAVAATLAIVWSAGPAAGQLKLDRPSAPAPGEGRALLDLARDLYADIESRTAALHGLAGRERAAAEFSIAARILARALLLKAEELGEPGSPHALIGLTLARRLDEIDATADGLREGDLPDEAAAASAVLAAQLREQYDQAPARTEDLDRWVRDLLALPVHAGGGLLPPGERTWEAEPWRAGWGAGSGADTELSEAAARWAGVPAPTVEAVQRFDAEVVRPARDWWAYRGTAETVAAAMVAAGRVAEPGGLPDWVPAEARDGLISRLGGAALSAIDPQTREDAMASLADLALAAALMDKLERLASASGLAPNARQRALVAARTALLAAATAPGSGRGSLAAFDTALRLLGERAQMPGEDTILRDVRPAWRAMAAAARDAEVHLWETLGRIGSGDAAMDDPAVVGAIAALRRALDDLAAVRAISAGLGAAGEPDAVRNMAAQRVLRLGQALAAPSRREAAAETLRRFGRDLSQLAALPGEEALAAGDGAWKELTGGRAAELHARIGQARGAWLDAWARERDDASADGAAEDMRRLRRLMTAVHECVLMREAGVNAWPGWELSQRAAAALERGARGPVERACGHVLAGDAAAADGALREYEQGWAAVRLAAALELRARERGVVRTPVLVELAAPPPPGGTGWLAPLRPDLAAVCRYAEELAHAEAAGGARRREALRAYVNERALGALERLGAAR